MKKSLNELLVGLGFDKKRINSDVAEYTKIVDDDNGLYFRGIKVGVFKCEHDDKEDSNKGVFEYKILHIDLICSDKYFCKEHKHIELNIEGLNEMYASAITRSGLLTIDKDYYDKSLTTIIGLIDKENKQSQIIWFNNCLQKKEK